MPKMILSRPVIQVSFRSPRELGELIYPGTPPGRRTRRKDAEEKEPRMVLGLVALTRTACALRCLRAQVPRNPASSPLRASLYSVDASRVTWYIVKRGRFCTLHRDPAYPPYFCRCIATDRERDPPYARSTRTRARMHIRARAHVHVHTCGCRSKRGSVCCRGWADP